jgi:DNA-binding CsgD family transcriptional regulator
MNARTAIEDAPVQTSGRSIEPERAARIWRGLAAGEWRVFSAVDHGGTRHLVLALAAPKERVDWGGLSAHEHAVLAMAGRGVSQKVIAIDVGRSTSSVSGLLRRVRVRLGFASLAELARAYRAHLGETSRETSGTP